LYKHKSSAPLDQKFIREHLHYVLNTIRKDGKYAPLEGGQGIAQPKWHSMVSKSSVGACKTGFLLVTWMDGNLKKSQISIQVTKE